MLSRLISLLSRIPAVKWAFNRLQPSLYRGSIEVTPGVADEQPAIIPEAASTLDNEPTPCGTDIETASAVAEDNTAIAFIDQASPGGTVNIDIDNDSSLETSAEVEPAVEESSFPSVEVASEPVDAVEVIGSNTPAERLTEAEAEVVNEAHASFIEIEDVDAPKPVFSNDLSAELLTDVAPEIVEEAPVSPVEVEAVETPEPVISGHASLGCAEDVEPATAEQVFFAAAEADIERVEASEPVAEDKPVSAASVAIEPVAADVASLIVVDSEITLPLPAEASVVSEPAPGVAAEIEPDIADDRPAVAAVAAEDALADPPVVAAQVEPPAAPAPKSPSAQKARAKIVEPADRATLIRLRWAETGIRMWNPRLHGTGEATLNIQGRIELLPPEPGETMPRYDKLEFKMLGGQIVCEGVIVEAPVHASQRSFTRLAETRGADRMREPVRERQAALA